MNLKDVMQYQRFVVIGDTRSPEKTACTIKRKMRDAGYTVYPVGKELPSVNHIACPIDIIDLCIHPAKGLALLQENRKPFRAVVIQPGAESPELIAWLEEQGISYVRGCLLEGLAAYAKK